MKKKFNFLLGAILATGFMTLGTVSCDKKPQNEDPNIVDPNNPGGEDKPVEPDNPDNPGGEDKPVEPPKDPTIADGFDVISLADAIAKANEAGEAGTDKPYIIYAKVTAVTNPLYGEMMVSDGTDSLYIYGIEGYSTMEVKPLKGDEVVLEGTLKTFNGKPEMGRATLKAHKKVEAEFDESQYIAKTISEARDLPIGDKVKLSGVVAAITYASGLKPNGFYLADDTGSIYVYDNDAVQQVKKGNKITVVGERTNWINAPEIEDAAVFGYQGCLQIANAIVTENDDKVDNKINDSWIEKTTVKEILETPTDFNITTNIYNVTGFVHKEIAPGYTNYYIRDLDDKTGTYVYTQANGGDFAWLDAYDGKLCDLYLSPINMKCTSAGTTYRFLPISVKESSYVMPDTEVGNFILDYYAKDQFLTEYNADPALEVITSASNEKLGFKDAKVSYTSSNEDVYYFAQENDKTIMHSKNDGSSTITISVDYNGKTTSSTVSLTYKFVDVSDAINVKAAIDAEDGTNVKVGGVVVASLVNRDGFYIGDETGVIAVTTTKTDLAKIHLGDEVYFEGERTHVRDAATDPLKKIGQSAIAKASLVLNKYGHHQYSTATFDDTKTISELINLPVNVDHTTQVYKVKGKIKVELSEYYSTIKVVDPKNESSELMLYCSNAMTQYKWLTNFKNDESVDLEVMLCNWNDKPRYKGAVLSVSNGINKIINNLNFANNK